MVLFFCHLCVFFMGVWVQVYKISIGAACGLSWPSDRLVIQVLDDSTDPAIKVYTLPASLFTTNIATFFNWNLNFMI